jgi:FAD/FMN-containing dehydrogenase
VIEQYGGAVRRVGRSETAFSHRDAEYDLIITSAWSDAQDTADHIGWARALWEAMRPFASGVYVNNLGDEGEDQVKAAYGENYPRLVTLKNKYDPSNFFSLNQNIRPNH